MNILERLPSMIDHTILKAEATTDQVSQLVQDAIEYQFAAVCVNPQYVKMCADILEHTEVEVCTVIDFPLGASVSSARINEAQRVVQIGASEIDIVVHLPHALNCDTAPIANELQNLIDTVSKENDDIVVKLIIESAALMQNATPELIEKRFDAVCKAAFESSCDFIKTSTGFHPAGGASVEAVKLMEKYGRGMQIKASGGIRSLDQALAMVDAGAWRLGLSGSVGIMKERAERLAQS